MTKQQRIQWCVKQLIKLTACWTTVTGFSGGQRVVCLVESSLNQWVILHDYVPHKCVAPELNKLILIKHTCALDPPALVTVWLSYCIKQKGNLDVCRRAIASPRRRETRLPACCRDIRVRQAGIIVRHCVKMTKWCHMYTLVVGQTLFDPRPVWDNTWWKLGTFEKLPKITRENKRKYEITHVI